MMNERHDDQDRIDDLAGDDFEHHALAALAEQVVETPPSALRGAVLATIADRPRAQAAGIDVVDLYCGRVRVLSELLADLDADEWDRVVQPYGWTVRQLLVHLAQIENYTAQQLAIGGRRPTGIDDPVAADHLAIGLDAIHAAVDDGSLTGQQWRAFAGEVVGFVQSERFNRQAFAPMHGWPFDASSALIARSFELWTHAEDVCRATGRPLPELPAAVLRTMSAASVNALPFLVGRLEGVPPVRPTRVVLTGAGGGTFDIGGHDIGGNSEVGAPNLLVADVVDYCRVVARRIEPDALVATREGDADVLDTWLRAAQLIAV